MDIGYSEFSFGYAFADNFIHDSWSRPTSAPTFPSLRDEGKWGYDVRIDLAGRAVFFQYKRPELLTRNSAREIRDYALPGLYPDFFRMPLMMGTISQQHNHLIDLECKFPGRVLYATPAIGTIHEFNRVYCLGEVHRQTILFSPKEIGPLNDKEKHHIAYRKGQPHGWLCSEPREIKAIPYVQFEEQVLRSFDTMHPIGLPEDRVSIFEETSLWDTAKHIREAIMPLVPSSIRRAEDDIQQRIRERMQARDEEDMRDDGETRQLIEHLIVSREIARVGLALDMHLAQPLEKG